LVYITRLKALKKKIDAILPNATELRKFLGCINYHCDMWPSCAHILKPLTDNPVCKRKLLLNGQMKCKKAFDKMCLLMAADALAAYPDHNKWFASDFQLGTCIIQEGRPVAYFSQKVMKSQQNNTTMEKGMLSIITTLKEFEVCSLVRTFMFLRIITT
jgi:hypothetical protein